jgi:hypothetical protein
VEVIGAMNESVETLLQTVSLALLLDLNHLRNVIDAAKEVLARADNEQAKRILSEVKLAEAVLDATQVYVDILVVISRDHRQTFPGSLH